MPAVPLVGARSNLIRWLVLALLVGVGLVLFFWYAPETDPVANPTVLESQP